MRTTSLALLLSVVLCAGCGALQNFADFDANHSALTANLPVAPADGNTVVTLTAQLRYSASSPAASLPVSISVTGAPVNLSKSAGITDANGMFTTTMTCATPGTARVVAALNGPTDSLSLATSVQFVSVAAGASLAMGSQATVGVPAQATLTILDQNGQRVLYYDGTVRFKSSDPQASLPPDYQFTTTDQGQHVFNDVIFQTAGTQSIDVMDAGRPTIQASVDGIEVFVQTAPMLEISAIASALAGTTNTVEVRAVDISTRTRTDYRGTVHFTSTDPQAALPADATFTEADAGVKVLPLTLKTAGVQSVNVVDVNNVVISGSQTDIAVWVQADRFALIAQAPTTAGVAVAVQVQAVDAYQNIDPNYAGEAVLAASDLRADLPPSLMFVASEAGKHDTQVTFYTAGTQTLSAQGPGPNFIGESDVTVVGAAAQTLGLLGPMQAAAGSISTWVATAYDAYGNVSSSYRGHLDVSSSDANASLPAGADATSASMGSAVLMPVIFTQIGTQTLTVTDANLAQSANAQVHVVGGAAASFVVSGLATARAGQSQSVTAMALDAYGNQATGYAGQVVITSDDVQAQLPQHTSFSPLDAGLETFSPVVLDKAGLRRVDVADASNPNIRGSQGNVLILPLAASKLVLSAPTQVVAGVAQNIMVQAMDTYGNLDPNFSGQITLRSSDVQATLPAAYTMTAADAGQVSLPATLYVAGTQTLSAASGAMTSLASSVTVVASNTTKASVSGLAGGRAGRTQNMAIQALDNFNNVVSTYTGNLQVTSSDTNAVLPTTVSLAMSDAGQKIVPVTLVTAGLQNVTVTDAATPSITGTQGNILIVAVADRLRVRCPNALTAGGNFNLTVAGVDAYGNVDANYVGTVTLSTTSTSSTLPATLTVGPGNQGVGTSSQVSLTGTGQSLSITAQDTQQAFVGTRSGIRVLPANAVALRVQAPNPARVDTPFAANLTAYDAYGNQATGYTGGVSLTSSDPNATLGSVTTFVSGGQGSAVAAGLLWSTSNANATLVATDVQTPSITGSQGGIVVNAGGAAKLRVSGATSGIAGHSDTITVTALDNRNNVAPGYTGTVHLSSTDGQAVLPSNYTFVSGDAGQHAFSLSWKTSGVQRLTAQDTGASTLTGFQGNIIIAPAPAVALRLTDLTGGSIVAGATRSLNIAAIDGFGNIDPNYTGVVALTSSDAAASLPASVTLNASSAGSKTVSYTLATAGTQSLAASDAGAPALVGNLTGLVVQPGPLSGLRVSGIADALAGTGVSASIDAVDAQGNRVPTYTGTVALSSSDSAAFLPGSFTFTAGDTGHRVAPLTLFTAGDQSVTATDTTQAGITGAQTHIHVLVSRTRLQVTTPPSVTASQAFNTTVAAVDAYGNVDPNYTGTVALTSSDARAYFGAASTGGLGSAASITLVHADAGQKTVPASALYLATGNASIQASDSAQSLSGQRSGIIVNPGSLDHVGVGAPGGVSPGSPFIVQISGQDNANNVVPSYTGTLSVACTDTNATRPSSVTLGSGDGGSVRISNWVLTSSGPQTLTLTDANGLNGNATVVVASLAPVALRVQGATNGVAGHSDSVTVTAIDAYGNPANGNVGVVSLTSTDAKAVLPAPFSMGTTASHIFSGVQFQTAGTQTLRASGLQPAGAILVGQQNAIIITRAATSRYTFSGLQDATAGQAQNIIVTATDSYGNLDPNATGTVALASSDPNAVMPASVPLVGGRASASVTLTGAGTQNVSASASGLSGVSPNVTIGAASATRLAVSGVPANSTGQTVTASVTAFDTYNNVATGYVGTIALSSTDAALSAASPLTLGAADAGHQNAPVTFFTAGTQTLTATDSANVSLSGQQTGIVVTAGLRFTLTTASSNVAAGQSTTLTVAAVTNSNVVDPSFTGTVHFQSSDPCAALPSDVTFTGADAGQKTLTGVTFVTAGSQRVMATTVPSGRAGESNVIHVSAGAPSAFAWLAPRQVVAGSNANITLSAVDAYGNTASGYTGTALLTSNDAQATLPTPVMFAAADAGSKALVAVLRGATSNATLRAVDANQSSFAGQQGNIVVLAQSSASSLALTGLVSGVAGQPATVTVTARDAFGNRVPQYRGSVSFSSTDTLAALPSSYSFASADQGAHASPNVILATAGTQNVTVTDGTNSATVTVTVTHAPASFFSLDTNHHSVSGQVQNVVITATDPYGNIDTSYSGSVALGSSDPLAVLPASYTYTGMDAGRHALPITWESAGTQGITAVGSAGATGALNGIVIDPGPTSRLSITLANAPNTGTAVNATVRALDAAGNVTPAYSGIVHMTSSDMQASLPSDYTYTMNAGGEHTASVIFASAGNQTLTVTDIARSSITGTLANISVTAPAVRLQLALAANTVAGAPAPLSVRVMDNFNNIATAYTGTILLTNSDAQATYGSQTTFAAADGGNKLVVGAFKTSGTQSVLATDSQGVLTSASASIAVSPNVTQRYDVSTASTVAAGGNLTLSLVARDAYGNRTSSYAGTAGFTSSDTSAVLPAQVVFSGGTATSNPVVVTRASTNTTFTATDVAQSALFGTTANVVVTPLTTSTLLVAGATSGIAGHGQNITVSARDIYNNLATTYRGVVSFSSSDAAATLPPNYTFVSGDAGTHNFSSVVLATVGTQALRANDTSAGSITGQQNAIVITAGPATHLTFLGPATVLAGAPQILNVGAADSYGNIDPTFRGTVTYASSDGRATLPGTYTFVAADAGRHDANVTLLTAGNQNVTVSSPGLTAGLAALGVSPGATSNLVLSGLAAAPAGTSQNLILRAVDNYNNTAPDYRGMVVFSSSDPQASLPGNYTYLSGDAGIKQFTAALLTQGLQQLRATDANNPNFSTAQNAVISVGPTQLTVASDTNVIAGVACNVIISATDIYGNINPNYTGTVHFTSSDANASLPADVQLVAANQGILTLTRQTTFRTAGQQTLSATDANHGYSGTQSGITVNAGPAAALAVQLPVSVTAGALFSISATAYDAYNNVATGYTGRITFNASDANATLPPATTFNAANQGVRAFSNGARLLHAGAQLITINDANNMLTGSAGMTVQSAAASALSLSAPTSVGAGTLFSMTLTALDAYGNTAVNTNDTVAFSGTDTQATYPSSVAFAPSDAGVKTLSNLTTLRTAGSIGVTASDTTNAGVGAGTTRVMVTPALIASFSIAAPASVTAGTNFSVTVAGIDSYSNVVSNYAATVPLISSDASGLPSSSTPFSMSFSSGSAAQRTLSNLRLMTAGTQQLSAADPNNSAIFGSAQVSVLSGSATTLSVTTATAPIAGQGNVVTVSARDSGGNLSPNFVGTVSFASTDANATLPAALSFTAADQGQKSTSASLVWRHTGSQTLTASSSGLSSGTAAVTVGAAAPAGLQLSGLTNLPAGSINAATLRAVDAFGNTATSYTGTVTWSSSDSVATLPASLTYAAADMGSKNANVRLVTAGVQSVTATDGANGFASTQNNVYVSVQASRFLASCPNTATAGTPFALNVIAADGYGNLDSNYTGALHFTSTDANATFPSGVSVIASDHGQHSVSGVVLTTVNPNARVTVLDNTNTIVGVSNAVGVSPANANRLRVVTAGTTPAGTPLSATVTAYDAYANVATAHTGTVAVSSNNANAILPSASTFASNANGVITIANIYLLSATTSGVVSVADTNNAAILGSQTGIVVTALGADHFTLSGMTNGVAGHTDTLNLAARDIYNNTAISYRGTATFASSDAGANLPTNYAYVAADAGVHAFSGVSLATLGSQSVGAHDTVQTAIAGAQNNIVITSNSATHLALTTTASVTAGQAQNVLIAAVDAYGNIDPNFAGSVGFSTTDPNAAIAASYVFSSADAGTHVVAMTYKTAASQTLTATGPAAVGNTQVSTQVSPSNANAFVVNGVPNLPAGQATSMSVRVIDAYNNTVPLYRGQTHVTSSDTNATLPGDYTFVASDAGIKSLGLTFKTIGTQWVRAADTNIASIMGQQNSIVVGNAQSHLQVSCNTNVLAGSSFSVTVTAVDAFGNLNAGYTGLVHFTSSDPNAVLPGNANITAANNGSITVPGAVLKTASANQSITATDTNVASYTGAQSGIRVNPAAVHTVVLTGPTTAIAGAALTPGVTAYDSYNNVATGYTGTVAYTSTDPNASLPATTTFGSSNAGTLQFSNGVTFAHAGNQNLVVTDANNALSSMLGVVVSPASAASLVLSAPASSTAGNVITAQVRALDAYGNLATAYRGTVAFTSGDPNASYPANYTFLAADNANHLFASSLIFRQSGAQTLRVSDTNNSSLGMGSAVVNVNPAPLSRFTVGAPGNSNSGASFVVSVAGLDAYNNVANSYNGNTLLTSTDPNGTPSGTAPITLAFSSGSSVQRSVSGVVLYASGTQTLYARDANMPATLNGQANVLIAPLAATTLALSGLPTPVAGQQGNLVVKAYDNYGNVSTTYTGTVGFASSDPNALLPASYTFVSADQGIHTFINAATIYRSGNQNVTVHDANALNGVLTFNVAAASPSKMAFTTSPNNSSVCSGALSAAVTFYDIYNNLATTGGSVTLRAASGAGQGALLGSLTQAAAGGVASFSGMSMNRPATAARIVATSTGVPGAVSNAFNVANVAPQVVSVSTPTADGANVTIPYAISDVCGANANVVVEVSVSGPSAYVRAMPTSGSAGITNLTTSASAGGSAHNFVWNSLLDLPYTSSSTAYVRVTAVARDAASSQYVVGPITVNNAPRASASRPIAASNYPTCIALADLNHDAKVDLVRCNEVDNGVSSIDILAGDANGNFALARSFVTLTGSSYVDVGDINRDGAPDLVVANALDPNVNVILLTKAGAQVSNTPINMAQSGAYSPLVKVLDVNGDAKLDLVVADTAGYVSVALGSGDGTFGSVSHTAVASGFDASIAAVDLNRDTLPDVVLTRGASNAVYTLFANGSGGWTTSSLTLTGTPTAVATGDFNHDAKPDVAVAVKGGNQLAVYWGTGGTSLGGPLLISTVASPNDVVATDYDSDGQLDLVARSNNGTVVLHRNLGNGTFGAAVTLGSGAASASSMRVADIKRDGRPDIMVSGAKATSSSMTLLTNITPPREPWQFSTARAYFTSDATNTGSIVQGAVLTDVNGDGAPDMVACDSGVGALRMWPNDGHGVFGTMVSQSVPGAPFAITSKDFNLDQIPDFAVADASVGIRIYRGTGSISSLSSVGTLAVSGTVADVVSGDINRDGLPDIVTVSKNPNNLVYFAGLGTGSFATAATTALGASPAAARLTDVNNDGLLDAVVLSNTNNTVMVLVGDGNGNFATAVNYATPTNPTSLAIADVNSDNYNDIIVGSSSGQVITVLTNKGTGLFNAYVNYTPSIGNVTPYSLHTADFNQDGNVDMAFYATFNNSGVMGWDIAWGNGHGGFSSVTAMQSSYVSPLSRMAAADVNGDGYLDLVSTDGYGDTGANQEAVGFAVALSKRSGGFRAMAPQTGNGSAATNQNQSCSGCGIVGSAQMQMVDWNNDGAVDIGFASPAGVRLWSNDGLGNFASTDFSNSPTQGTGAGLWVAFADLNQDTWPDVTLSNQQSYVAVGVNNKTGGFAWSNVASGDQYIGGFPMADWDRNGTLDGMALGGSSGRSGTVYSNAAGSYTLGGAVNICSGSATNPYYGAGVTGDIDNNGTPDIITDASNGYQCVGLNNGSGSFSVASGSPLSPRYGQSVLADINMDGNLDLLSGTPYTQAGPVVRLGNGDGTFSSTPTVVGASGGGMGVAVADVNGDGLPDIIYPRAGNTHPWTVRIFTGHGDGTFDAPVSFTAPAYTAYTGVSVADFDADGHLDLAIDNGANFQVILNK